MATYQEQIAQWRQQRAQQQINDRLQQIRSEHAQVVRERDQAIASNDMETAELRDMDVQQLEQEWNHYNPPQQQQVHPAWTTWMQRNASFIEREGQRGVQAVTDALAWPPQSEQHRSQVQRDGDAPRPDLYPARTRKVGRPSRNPRLAILRRQVRQERATADAARRGEGLQLGSENLQQLCAGLRKR